MEILKESLVSGTLSKFLITLNREIFMRVSGLEF
jgi:hypothetical protein